MRTFFISSSHPHMTCWIPKWSQSLLFSSHKTEALHFYIYIQKRWFTRDKISTSKASLINTYDKVVGWYP